MSIQTIQALKEQILSAFPNQWNPAKSHAARRQWVEDLIDSVMATAAGLDSDGDGNLDVTGAGKGIVLKSEDGTRWLLNVDNDGNLYTTEQI